MKTISASIREFAHNVHSLSSVIRPDSSLRRAGVAILVTYLSILGPGMISANSAELLYVRGGSNSIITFDVSLSSAAAITTSQSTFVSSGADSATGLAFDSSGNLYQANAGGNLINRFDSSGALIGGVPFVPAGQGLSSPWGLAFDTSGNLYATNSGSNTITRYDTNGVRMGTDFVPSGQGLSSPYGLAFDASGNLYASSPGNSAIVKYDSNGNRIGTNFVSGLSSPQGVAFRDGYLYVSETSGNRINRYDSSGALVGGVPFATAGLSGPIGMAFDSSGNLYVANVSNSTISKYNTSGVLQFSWVTPVAPRFLAFVPEPSTYVLCGLATGVMALLARRKQRAAKAIAH